MLTVRTSSHGHLRTPLGKVGQYRHNTTEEAKNNPVNFAQN